MYLFVDTETTGLPEKFNSLNSYQNVRLVQLAWIIYDCQGKKISKRDFIVKPEGFEIPEQSTKIHKISNSFASSAGKSLKKVLIEFNKAIIDCKFIIAHNIIFDFNVLYTEFERIGLKTTIQDLKKICTMTSTTDYCGVKVSNSIKWPTLNELYKKIFNQNLIESHNAAIDIDATAKCFWYLKRNKIIEFEKINEEKKTYCVNNQKIVRLFPIGHIFNKSTTEKSTQKNNSIKNTYNMNLKEYAISLKSYCESIKDGDSVSKRQMERLYQMLDELIYLIDQDEISDDLPDAPSSNNTSSRSSDSYIDDLPF
jgi:DNA polymerase-3 subunit epsilon